MNKNILIGIAVAIVIAIGGYFFPQVQGGIVERIVGNSAGPERTNSCESTNGVMRCWARQKLTVATTTPCNIKTRGATSTIVFASIDITTSTSTATTWTLATSTVPNATTTALQIQALASGQLAQFAKFATSTSGANSALAGITPPNTYISWGAEGFFPSDVTKLNGYCQAEWIEL